MPTVKSTSGSSLGRHECGDSRERARYGLATHFASILIAAHFAQIVVDFFGKVRSKERVYRNALVIGLPGTVRRIALPERFPQLYTETS